MNMIRRAVKSSVAMMAGVSLALLVQGTATADESMAAIPVKRGTQKRKLHDPSLAIAVEAALHKLKHKPTLTLVDVRPKQDYAKLRIPGSIHIPLHFIKTKSYLKADPIVLVNEGFHYSRLVPACQRLSEMGFKPLILDGGLPAWKHRGGRLAGDLSALERMRIVSPSIFFQEKDYGNVLVIDISPVPTDAAPQVIPYAIHVPVAADFSQLAQKLNQLIAKHKNKSFFALVVLNANGEPNARVEDLMTKIGVNPFYLRGGIGGYRRYLESMELSWQPRASRMKTFTRCQTCDFPSLTATRHKQ
ncbi:MAG: rhodanese-like domain-containing protein [Desulfobacterales bacterium]|nr:MAG: rhodanese-like domain-containing protein [Desulfobacterales bacterium]